MLTGLRDGGSGADGTPTPDSTSGNVLTFSAKDTWNFTSLSIPKNEVWRFTGGASNLPVKILVTSNVDIAGVLDVSGGDGRGSIDEAVSPLTFQSPYGLRYSSAPGSGTTLLAGGTAMAGGGKGGDGRFLATGVAGTAGYGGSSSTPGAGGQWYSSTYATGGGGGGHAQAGQAGGLYNPGYGSPASGGTSYGTTSFSSGMTAGSGGGSGCSFYTYYYVYDPVSFGSSTYNYYYFIHVGGAGGGGGGAVKVVCNGTFVLRGSGIIDASGGEGGGGFYYYTGGGGGGSGGGVWIMSGGNLTLGGLIDVRGGFGGEPLGYHPYSGGSPTRYGAFGGHGAAGRVRLEAPNIGSTTTNFVAGTAFNTIAAGSLNGGNGALGAFPGSSSTTINIDSLAKDATGAMNFTTMNIPSGVTVTLTGSSAAKMRFSGDVTINGVLSAPGGNGAAGAYSSNGTAANISAGTAGPGGGIGGLPNPSSTTTFGNGGSGGGSGGGGGGIKANQYSTQVYGSSSGGGGSNLLNFAGAAVGTTPGGIPATYNNFSRNGNMHAYYNAGYGSVRAFGAMGAGFNEPDAITMANLAGGGGGGAGANAGYYSGSTAIFYGASSGGGGAGAIGIETAGTFSMGSGGALHLVGGNGGQYAYSYMVGAGAGGAGGTALVRANSYSLTSGASIRTWGGIGGHAYSGPTSYNMNTGGVGGLGAARIEGVSLPSVLNHGGILGYSSTTGSLTTSSFTGGGDTGATNWMTAAGLAPDFHSGTITKQGPADLQVEGAMADPFTGLRSATRVTLQNATTTPLTQGLGTPDPVDGHRNWRVIWKMAPPSVAFPAIPEVYDSSVGVDTK
jgi:hypothetical protein